MTEIIQNHFTSEILIKLVITIVFGLSIMFFLKRVAGRYFKKHKDYTNQNLFNKLINFIGYTLIIIIILNQLGFGGLFTTVLGTAGIAGMAIGFGAKTTIENIISGVLLYSDKSFKIGDRVDIDNTEGVIEAVDSLSVKIRTNDNKLVRIPNTKVINSKLTNLYPDTERRKDFYFTINYTSDISKIEKLLIEIAQRNPYAIKKDETFIFFYSFEEIGMKIKYGVWFKNGDMQNITNSITIDISETFKKEGIAIPTLLLNNPNK